MYAAMCFAHCTGSHVACDGPSLPDLKTSATQGLVSADNTTDNRLLAWLIGGATLVREVTLHLSIVVPERLQLRFGSLLVHVLRGQNARGSNLGNNLSVAILAHVQIERSPGPNCHGGGCEAATHPVTVQPI